MGQKKSSADLGGKLFFSIFANKTLRRCLVVYFAILIRGPLRKKYSLFNSSEKQEFPFPFPFLAFIGPNGGEKGGKRP